MLGETIGRSRCDDRQWDQPSAIAFSRHVFALNTVTRDQVLIRGMFLSIAEAHLFQCQLIDTYRNNAFTIDGDIEDYRSSRRSRRSALEQLDNSSSCTNCERVELETTISLSLFEI